MKSATAAAAMLLLACCSPGARQEIVPPPQQAISRSADLASQDRDFLEKASEGNNAEVAMGAIANGHAEDAGVLAFGRMMVADHGAAQKRLQAIAAAKQIAPPTGLGEHQAGYDRLIERHGRRFDAELAKTMVDDHHEAADLFKSEATNGFDPDLKAYAAATLPTIESHLEQAKALAAAVVQEPPQP
ncbi:MAG: outer membrane protein [Acidobacteria bacterium]|nr:outer membrane protein [Acidobacteriota bacterium]